MSLKQKLRFVLVRALPVSSVLGLSPKRAFRVHIIEKASAWPLLWLWDPNSALGLALLYYADFILCVDLIDHRPAFSRSGQSLSGCRAVGKGMWQVFFCVIIFEWIEGGWHRLGHMSYLDLGIDLMSPVTESTKTNLFPNPVLFCRSTTVSSILCLKLYKCKNH